MRHLYDQELHGHCLVFNGPLDLVNSAVEAVKGPNIPPPFKEEPRVRYPGRTGDGWKCLQDFLHSPWPEAVKRVNYIKDKIAKEPMPEPKSVRRKPKLNETDGDIDIDRALQGEPDFYRRHMRERVTGPTNISLVCNLDNPQGVNPSGLFYRSTAAIAITDILENLGYQVEIIMWSGGKQVFAGPDHEVFVVCRIKEAGQTVDVNSLCDTMSAWFVGEAVFPSFCACPVKPIRLGLPMQVRQYAKTVKESGMGGWVRYLDIAEGTLAVPVPMVYGSLDNATELAKEVLTNIIETQG